MLASLASSWGLLLFRGSFAVVFAVLTLLWPGPSLATLAVLLAGYAAMDGLAGLIVAVRARSVRGSGSLFAEAIVGLAAAAIAVAVQGRPTALLVTVALWAALRGVVEVVAASTLRREVSEEWPLAAAGGLSLIFGALLLPRVGPDVFALTLLLSTYALLFGTLFVVVALRLRRLADEIPAAQS